MALHILTWLWGHKYPRCYVDRLERGLARHLAQEYSFRVCRPLPCDEALTAIPGCFARLRTFDQAWQDDQGIASGDRIVSLDLDLVITGSLDGLFDRTDDFAILQGINASNPCPYNGSVWMLRAGYRPDVWEDFSLETAARVPFDKYPDDQAWFAAKMPGAGSFGPSDGVYAFCKPGWPKGEALPSDARIVAFPGYRDPSQFGHLDWVRKHWS